MIDEQKSQVNTNKDDVLHEHVILCLISKYFNLDHETCQ